MCKDFSEIHVLQLSNDTSWNRIPTTKGADKTIYSNRIRITDHASTASFFLFLRFHSPAQDCSPSGSGAACACEANDGLLHKPMPMDKVTSGMLRPRLVNENVMSRTSRMFSALAREKVKFGLRDYGPNELTECA